MAASLPEVVTVSRNNDVITYFTNNRRGFVTDFYKNEFLKLNCSDLKLFNLFCFIQPLKINHSTSLAPSFLAPKQKSTYLEEYFYPLRDSIIVNGYEPYDANGKAFDKSSQPLIYKNNTFFSQVTVRVYSSSVWSRILVYLLIWACGILGGRMFNKIRG